jgi:hypothetical protein
MISFLSPLFLAGAAAAAIPLVLHLLRREPEPRVKFPAVKLLKHAPVEHTQKRRLRELLLLALRISALVLLALAFARPFLPSGVARGSTGTTVIVLDTSYSMSAPGRFDRAKQLAKAAISRAKASDLVGVVTFADAADVAARPSSDRVLAAAAIDAAAPGFGATRYRAGLSAASQMLGGRRGSIVVVTDLQESGWDTGDHATVPDATTIDVADVGAAPDDFGVAAVHAAAAGVVATIRNTSARAREARVHLMLDGKAAGDGTVSIGPNTAADVTLPSPGRAATIAVAVEDRDGLQANNTRFAVGGATRPPLLVVTASGDLPREAFYVQAALEASAPGTESSYAAEGVGAAQLGGWTDDRLASSVAVVLLSTRGLERHGRELLSRYVRGGGGVLIAAGADVDGGVAADLLGGDTPLQIVTTSDARPEPRALAPADARHPIFQRFGAQTNTLGLVQFQQVARIAGAGCQVLARFTTGESALIDCTAGDGRALVLASDLNDRWNDFPLHATYVPFLHEAVKYLSSARPHGSEYFVGEAPGGVPQTPGVASLPAEGAGRVPRRIAVNVDPRESDPARMSVADFQSAVTRLKEEGASDARVEARQQEDRQHLWQYVLALALLMLAAEGAVASRTA